MMILSDLALNHLWKASKVTCYIIGTNKIVYSLHLCFNNDCSTNMIKANLKSLYYMQNMMRGHPWWSSG